MREFIETIVAALKEHPLSQQILQFLVKHDGAMDTIDGVANCWVNIDPVAVKSVLDSLQHAGVVVTRVLSSGTYYRLTTNVEVRAWLKTYCETCGRAQRALASSNELTATGHRIIFPTLRLNIHNIKAEFVLFYDSVYSTVTASADSLTRIGTRPAVAHFDKQFHKDTLKKGRRYLL